MYAAGIAGRSMRSDARSAERARSFCLDPPRSIPNENLIYLLSLPVEQDRELRVPFAAARREARPLRLSRNPDRSPLQWDVRRPFCDLRLFSSATLQAL